MRTKTWLTLLVVATLCGMLSPARADRVVIADFYAEPDLRDQAGAVTLLVRSMLSVPEFSVVSRSAMRGAGEVKDPRQYLAAVGADYVVVGDVSREGTSLKTTVRVLERSGRDLAAFAALAGEGDVQSLALSVTDKLAKLWKISPKTVDDVSLGQLREYVRADYALRQGDPDAVKYLAAADTRIAGRVGAVKEISQEIWSDTKAPSQVRMQAALAGLATDQVVKMADELLAKNPKDSYAVAMKARALVGNVPMEQVEDILSKNQNDNSVQTMLARAEIAHFQNKPTERDAALKYLLSSSPVDPAVLSFIASLSPGTMSKELESLALEKAQTEQMLHPGLASAMSMRAIRSGDASDANLALIQAGDLDQKQLSSLAPVVQQQLAAGGEQALRLQAEIAMRSGDPAKAQAAISAYYATTSNDYRRGLYRARELMQAGKSAEAAAEIAKITAPKGEWSYEMARMFAQNGDFEKAKSIYEGLANNTSVEAIRARAASLLAEGNGDAALRELLSAELLSPANLGVQAAQVELYKKMGDQNQADIAQGIVGSLAIAETKQQIDAVAQIDNAQATVNKPPEVVALAAYLKEELDKFPSLTARMVRSALVIPIEGSHEGFYKPRQIHPEKLKAALELALNTDYRVNVKLVSTQEMEEPLDTKNLISLALSAQVDAVVLYKVRTSGSNAKAKIVIFSLADGLPLKIETVLPGDTYGLVSWNAPFFLAILLLVAGAGSWIGFLVWRGWGEIHIRLKTDSDGNNDVFKIIVSKDAKRPDIGDLHTFRAETTSAGHKTFGRTATMIGPTTRFGKIPPGNWWIHLVGVYERSGENRVLDQTYSTSVAVIRNQPSYLTFDLSPKMGELRLKVYDSGRPAAGAFVWFTHQPDKKERVSAEGDAKLEAKPGEYQVHVEHNGFACLKQVIIPTISIHKWTFHLDQEKRMAGLLQDNAIGDNRPLAAGTHMSAAPNLAQHPGNEPFFDTRAFVPTPEQQIASYAEAGAGAGLAGGGGANPTRQGTPMESRMTQGQMAANQPGNAKTLGVAEMGPGLALQLSRYQVVSELGRGAMGVVFKALDTNLDREVAMKIISEELKNHPEAMKLFMQEAKALAQLNHPNIVSVYDQGDQMGQAYMIMEFVDGSTLEHILNERGGALEIADAIDIIEQVCAGLGYAHERRIIHRDIKPANVFVSKDGIAKIGDFGLARVMRELSLRRTEIRGTPLYMAPEQILGKNVSHRSDIYAVGCTLFEAVVGQPPFTDGDILYHHMHTEPPRASDFSKTVPPELDDLIARCIAKESEDRIDSAVAIRKELRRIRAQF